MDALRLVDDAVPVSKLPKVGTIVWTMSRNSVNRIPFLVASYRWSGGPNNISIKPHLRMA
jgi:hypothetical protein